MPIYEYVCHDCGYQFDAIRQMKDADQPIQCQKCESENTKRKLSVFFASSEGRAIASSSGGCAGCGSGSCGTCGSCHH